MTEELYTPNPVITGPQARRTLSQPCELVTAKEDIDYMIKQLEEACDWYKGKALAVAGPQIGIMKCIFVSTHPIMPARVFINPGIVDRSRPFVQKGEGCLSFPTDFVDTNRYKDIQVSYLDREFNRTLRTEQGTIASICMQHEIDHLMGKLFFDRDASQQGRRIRIKRNDPCYCGSGKKTKKCCERIITEKTGVFNV